MHRIFHLDGARPALTALCTGFFPDLEWLDSCEELPPESMPSSARNLLLHENHMTSVLGDHHGQPVELNVLDYRQAGDQYRRKIVLTVDEGRRVVEFGVVRLDLGCLLPEARKAILARRQPLGDIFGQHQVLTRVQPLWYLRFSPECPIVDYFRPLPAGSLYGRIGVIHCDGRPALELLEVVRTDLG